jgi:hypothetical protein
MASLIRKWSLALLLGATAWPGAASAADRVVKHLPGGSELGRVGIVDKSEDTEITGPQALYAGEDGQLYLLDQVNGRILRFDPKRPEQVRALALPEDLQPTDLIVRQGDIMVWDGEVRALRPTGDEEAPTRGLEEFSTRAADDEFTTSAFAQMGSQKPSTEDPLDENTRALATERAKAPTRQAVSTKGRGPVIATVTPDKDNTAALIEVRAQGRTEATKLRLRVSDRLGAVEFLDIDRQGRMFVLAENIPPTSDSPASAFVVRFAQSGAIDGIYELPLSRMAAPSRRFVTISPEGEVFFLRTREASVDVIGVGFRPLRNTKVIETRVSQPSAAAPSGPAFAAARRDGKGPVAAVRPLSRQQVIETAFAFENVRWRVTPAAYGRDPDSACTGFNRIRRPGYLHGKLNQEVRGIPYCWGCMGSLGKIRTLINGGVMAGNVCTRNTPRRDVAGVDCSAFVSATWGLSTHFTTIAIPSITTPLSNAWDLRPGDALNKPGSHVMLFVRFTPDRKAEVIEAATGGCNGRVCRNVYPLSALLARGYTPVRYRALAGDTSAPAVAQSRPMNETDAAPVRRQDQEALGVRRPQDGFARRETQDARRRQDQAAAGQAAVPQASEAQQQTAPSRQDYSLYQSRREENIRGVEESAKQQTAAGQQAAAEEARAPAAGKKPVSKKSEKRKRKKTRRSHRR